MKRNYLTALIAALCAFGFTAQASPKVGSVTVESQSGTLCATTAGAVTYLVTVYRGNLPQSSGQFIADLSIVSALPDGVSYSFVPASLTFSPGSISKTSILIINTSPATPGGEHAFTVRAQNRAMPFDYAQGIGSLVLGAPPVFTLAPLNILAPTDPGLCSGTVVYDAIVSGVPTPVMTYEFEGATGGSGSGTGSGSVFNVGVTTVTLTASNSCEPDAVWIFSITVNDAEPPVISGPAYIYLPACVESVVLPEPTVTDNCGATWESSHASPLLLNYGQSVLVTYTAKDDANNYASHSFYVSRANQLIVDAGPNAHSYFGYAPSEDVERTVIVSGGKEPYTYEWTMNRPLICNEVNDDGDEVFSGGDCINNTCPDYPANDLGESPLCAGSQTILARLMEHAEVTVTVTDADGCVVTDHFTIYAGDARCFAGKSGQAKVAVCHQTSSRKNPCVSVCIHPDDVVDHLEHGDFLGNCTESCDAHYKSGADTDDHAHEAQLYPNPTTGLLNVIMFADEDEDVTFVVMNLLGQVMYSKTTPVTMGYHTEVIDLSDFAGGIYRVQLKHGDHAQEWLVMVSQ